MIRINIVTIFPGFFRGTAGGQHPRPGGKGGGSPHTA